MNDEEGPTTPMIMSQPIGIEKKKTHWWQDIPRRLSFTRSISISASSENQASPVQSPISTENQGSARRFSATSAASHETRAEVRERWNRNYNIPPELFIPPWI